MKKRYMRVDLHRNCFTVSTRWEDGRGESEEWSIRSLKGFAKTVKAKEEVAAVDLVPAVWAVCRGGRYMAIRSTER